MPCDRSWRDNQSTSPLLGSNKYIISIARQKLNSIQLLPHGENSITSFLKILQSGADLKI